MEVFFIIFLSVIVILLIITIASDKYLSKDSRIYVAVLILGIGIIIGSLICNLTTPTIEDYKLGNYKIKVTTEEVDGVIKSDTIYLKK